MDEKEKEILTNSLEMFFRLGVRNVSMDDISAKLGISKKTLYQYFSTKAELVESIMLTHLSKEKNLCGSVSTDIENAIDQILEIYKFNYKHLNTINPATIFELKKYYSSIWKHFEEHKHRVIYESVLNNLKLGINQGLYRDDMNPEVISRLYTSRMDIILDGEAFPQNQFSFWDVMKELFIYHVRGIATKKGIKYLENIQLNF